MEILLSGSNSFITSISISKLKTFLYALLISLMAFSHRKLLSSTVTIIIPKPPCLPLLCFNLCSCEKPPPPPPPPPPVEHHLVSNGMTIMACVLGVFFILGIVCIIARLKYLRRIESRRRNLPVLFHTQVDFIDEDRGPVVDHPIWLINFVGLQQSVIDSITVCKYRRGEGLVEGTECSVCLGEFEEDENLRLLPKCSHAFHLPCIDTWLRSHKNCPLCRAPVVSDSAVAARIDSPEETQLQGSDLESGDGSSSGIDGIGDVGFGSATTVDDQIRRNGPNGLLNLNVKNCDSRTLSDLADDNRKMGLEGEVQPMRRSVSMDSPSASMIYLAVANASKRQGYADGAEWKRSSFKSCDKHGGGSGNTSTSLYRMMKSASLGRVLQKGPVSIKRSRSTRNCRSQDLTLPCGAESSSSHDNSKFSNV